MKIIPIPVVVLVLLSLIGCSMPTSAVQGSLYSILKQEKQPKAVSAARK